MAVVLVARSAWSGLATYEDGILRLVCGLGKGTCVIKHQAEASGCLSALESILEGGSESIQCVLARPRIAALE